MVVRARLGQRGIQLQELSPQDVIIKRRPESADADAGNTPTSIGSTRLATGVCSWIAVRSETLSVEVQ